MRKFVPAMRERRSGVIVNMSSTAGIQAKPSRSMYSGSKFALEVASEALFHEMQPFNARVLLVEPGAFNTSFASSCQIHSAPLPGSYKGTITEQTITAVKNLVGGNAKGDVKRGAKAIFDVVMKEGQARGFAKEWLRLPLGTDNAEGWRVKMDDLRENLEATEQIWKSTDKDED